MGFESVELVRRVYLAWQAGDLEELLSFVDPEVSWSPVLRFLEGRGLLSAIGSAADGFATFESPTAVSGPCRSLRGSRLASAGADGWSVPGGWKRGTSTFRCPGSGPSAPAASSPYRPSWRKARCET
jgi:hypothetical protein